MIRIACEPSQDIFLNDQQRKQKGKCLLTFIRCCSNMNTSKICGKKVILIAFFISLSLHGNFSAGVSLNNILVRTACYKDEQKNCNEEFIKIYKNLSRSVNNLSIADSQMLLFTRKNPTQPELLHKCGGKLPPNTNFNPKRKLVVIFLPFMFGYCDTAVYREWTFQLLEREDINIIVFDSAWGTRVDYGTAVLNARNIIKYQATILLKNIQKQTGISKKRITFIGQDLGAQISGLVGDLFHVHRIIGLDPAGTGFDEATPLKDRLDQSDADLVEVWHCNAGPCLPKGGIDYDAGNVNFYINGGSVQNSCYAYARSTLMRGDYIQGAVSLLHPDFCSHYHCPVYFKVSINPGDCQFVGVKCDSEEDFKAGRCRRCGRKGENCLIMGYDTDKYIKNIPRTPQKYYVKTSMQCPYCDMDSIDYEGYFETYSSSLQSFPIWKFAIKEGIKFLRFVGK